MKDITLGDIIDLIDVNRESNIQKIQICHRFGDWDEYDTVTTSSELLVPFEECIVKEIGAAEMNTIRVDIEWKREGEHD